MTLLKHTTLVQTLAILDFMKRSLVAHFIHIKNANIFLFCKHDYSLIILEFKGYLQYLHNLQFCFSSLITTNIVMRTERNTYYYINTLYFYKYSTKQFHHHQRDVGLSIFTNPIYCDLQMTKLYGE